MTKLLLTGSLYNPLSTAEWEKFFSLVNFSLLSKKDALEVKQMFITASKNNPLVCRLIREQKTPFAISFFGIDDDNLDENNATGLSFNKERRITWDKENIQDPATAFHEMRHVEQEEKGLFLTSSAEIDIITNKLMEAECAAISASFGDEYGYFKRLLTHNENKIKKSLTEAEIPYAPNLSKKEKEEAKKLYIKEKALSETMAEFIALLMQPNGAETEKLVAEFGLFLLPHEREEIHAWRKYYGERRSVNEDETELFSETGFGEDKDAMRVKQKMVELYPELKKYNFFKLGMTNKEKEQQFIGKKKVLKEGKTYYKNKRLHTEIFINEEGLYVERIYRNDKDNTLAYECHYDENYLRHKSETHFDENQEPIKKTTYVHGEIQEVEEKAFPTLFDSQEKMRILYEYQEGKCHKITHFDEQGNLVLETIGHGLDLKDDEKTGQVENIYHSKDKLEIKKEILTYKNGEEKEILSYDEDGNLVKKSIYKENSRITYDETGKKNVRIYSMVGAGEYTFHRITFKDGSVQKGYAKEGRRIGLWKTEDKDKKITYAFYTGLVKNKKPETITPPAKELLAKGYLKDKTRGKGKTARYYKKNSDGTYQVCYLDKKGFIAESGQEIQDKKTNKFVPIGHWLFFKDGVIIARKKKEPSSNENAPKIDETPKIAREEGKITEYYLTGEIKSIETENGYTEFNIKGGITYESFENEGVFYHVDKQGGRIKKRSIGFSTEDDLLEYTASYRLDGTKKEERCLNPNGNGWVTGYKKDGKTIQSHGQLKNNKREGKWYIKQPFGIEIITYKDGKKVGRSETNYTIGASINEIYRTPVKDKRGYDENGCLYYHRLIKAGDFEGFLKETANFYNLNETTKYNRSPLALAAMYGQTKIMDFMFENKVQMNARNEKGLTVIHELVEEASLQGLKVCLSYKGKNKPDLNALSEDGLTPLDYLNKELEKASGERKIHLLKMKKLLLENGAKTHQEMASRGMRGDLRLTLNEGEGKTNPKPQQAFENNKNR